MNEAFDVAIIGGGPAGSSAGSLLAKKGRRVIILERDKFPRFKIGESMLPSSADILDRMGVKEKIDQAGFTVKYGGEIVAACGAKRVRFYFKNGWKSKRESSYQILRSKFDKILLDHARELGCDVREETAVGGVNFDEDGASLQLENGEKIRARYVIDCSGRNCLVGNQFQLRQPYPELKKFSVYAYYEDVKRPGGKEGSLTRMIRATDSWFWMIPLADNTTSIGVVMDASLFKSLKLSPEAALNQCISEQPMVNEWMTNARRVTPVFATSDFSYRNSRLAGDRWLLAGDAAGFVDPIFSSGVYLALLSGDLAARALNQTFDESSVRERAFATYEKRVGRVLDLYLKWAKAWYTQEFVEVFLFPKELLSIVPTVNAVLSGNEAREFGMRWRLWIFDMLVRIQGKTSKIAPPLSLSPKNAAQHAMIDS
jgi:flavin-dependent dehydrogenase